MRISGIFTVNAVVAVALGINLGVAHTIENIEEAKGCVPEAAQREWLSLPTRVLYFYTKPDGCRAGFSRQKEKLQDASPI